MSEFEFVFSLFSLVLGLTLVEVLGGFVRSMKQVRTRRETSGHIGIGLLTPLLAVFMMLDVSSYWISIWGIRDGITVGYPAVFLGLIVTGGYYYAASMVFPDDFKTWPHLDLWFWEHRRQALGPLFVITLVGALLHDSMSGAPTNPVALYVLRSLYFGMILVAGLARSRSVVVVALTSLSLLYLGVGLAETIGIAV